jgi:hypothetical protein
MAIPDILPWHLYNTLTSAFPTIPQAQQASNDQQNVFGQLEQDYNARQGAASDAFKNLQSGMASPMPQAPGPNPGQFFGDIASIISKNPEYSKRAEAQAAYKQAQAMQARNDNLEALKLNYQKLAQAASTVNPILHTKYLEKIDAASKQQQLLAEQAAAAQKHGFDLETEAQRSKDEMARQALANKGILDAANVRANATTATPPALKRFFDKPNTTVDGKQWVNASGLSGKLRDAASLHGADTGIPTITDKADKLEMDEIQTARLNMNKMMTQVSKFLPPNWQSRPEMIPQIGFQQFLKSNNLLSAFGSWRENVMTQLKATARITGNRQAQKQYDLILKNDMPQIGWLNPDPLPVALQRMANVDAMLQSRQDVLLNPDLSNLPEYNAETPPGYMKVGNAAPAPVPPTGNKVIMLDTNNKRWAIDPSEVPDAIKHNWKRSQ